jgi:hypothetical protein
VGIIKASKSQRFKEADVVTGMLPWVTHIVLDDKRQVGRMVTAEQCLAAAWPAAVSMRLRGCPLSAACCSCHCRAACPTPE